MPKEKEFTEEIECIRCHNKVNMEVYADVKVNEIYIPNLPEEYDGATDDEHWQIVKCPACKNLLLRDGWWNEFHGDENGPNYRIIFPTQDKRIIGLPVDIQKAYDAAMKVKIVDSNAFAVLLGRVLDKVLLQQSAKGGGLNEKLNDLANRGLIPQTIVDAAHGVRQLRNIGAHADLGELTEAEIPILEDIINVILEYIYSAPDMIARVKIKIDQLKQKP